MEEVQIIFEKPKFDLYQKVFFVYGPGLIEEAEITAYRALVIKVKEGMMAVTKAARLSTLAQSDYFKDVDYDDVPLKYLTTNRNTATEWAAFYPVHRSDKDWFKAIGKRPTFEEIEKSLKDGTDCEQSLDECELQRCCGHISDIRDVFERCQEQGGLIGWDRKYLKLLIEQAPHDMEHLTGPILLGVLKQLNLEFEWMK